MSDQPGTESFEDDLGSYSVDDAVDAGSAQQDELLDTSEGDNEPWSPPDLQPRNTEWGTTGYEQAQDETIDQRIEQEVQDPNSAYGAPDDEGGLDEEPRLGGDDPDAIDPQDDFLADPEVGDEPVGQLTEPDEGGRPDVEPELLGQDRGLDAGGLSPEESAMHIVDEG
jgi:Family of unknown function (DUF5709)